MEGPEENDSADDENVLEHDRHPMMAIQAADDRMGRNTYISTDLITIVNLTIVK